MVFEGTTGTYEHIYHLNSKWIRKNLKYANLKCIWRIFFICTLRPSLKTGMDFRDQVWKQVWKMTFLLWNRVRIWKTRQQTLTKNSKECPPSHPRAKKLSISKFAPMMNYTLLGQNCAEIDLRYPQLSFLILGTPQQRGYCAILSKENQDRIIFFLQHKSWMYNNWLQVEFV